MDLFDKTAVTTPSRLECMNPADAHLIKALASNMSLVEKFAHPIALYARLDRKPEDILRRFSLNGDNKLDLKEFQPALKRLFGRDVTHAQAKDIFLAFCPTSAKKLDIDIFCQIMNHWSGLAQRMQDNNQMSFMPKQNNTFDNQSNLRRGLEMATLNYDKLNDMFLKMDIGYTGYLTKEEFELAMSHLGIYLTIQEYEQMYAQLPTSVNNPKGIFYSGFLSMLGIKMSSLFQNQKVWENLLANSDTLRCHLKNMLKQGITSIAVHKLRETLGFCGLTLSNADFTGLRMRLQSYTLDSSGEIQIISLLDALNDKAALVIQGNSALEPASPIKRGKKKAPEDVNAGVAAGKTTEQRNAEASHSLVKMSDHKIRTEFGQTFLQPPVLSPTKEVTPLEERILRKLEVLREKGPSQFANIRNVFPSDRFGKISRGLLRQSLSQLGIVTRQTDVEMLFWKLDPNGQGYIFADKFYKYLQKDDIEDKHKCEENNVKESRILDALRSKIPNIMRICRQIDTGKTGCLSKADFIWAMQEAGLIMSQSDAQEAISALSARKDGAVIYSSIEAKLQALEARIRQSSVHLSNAALLLDQSLESSSPQLSTKYQDYSARRSTIVIGHDFREPPIQEHEKDLTYSLQPNSNIDPRVKAERSERQAHAKRISLIQSILERRSELKSCFDMYPYKPVAGSCVVLGLEEIAEIVASARLGLDVSTLDEALEFVQSIIPNDVKELSFVEFIRLLNITHHNENRLHHPPTVVEYSHPKYIEKSIQTKLIQQSTLKDVNSNRWQTTASIIVRHAFKGLASRDMTTVASTGGLYDALCRNADLKHICYRLSLDLTPQECHYLLNHMEVLKRGYFSSTELFQCFTSLLFPQPHPTPDIA